MPNKSDSVNTHELGTAETRTGRRSARYSLRQLAVSPLSLLAVMWLFGFLLAAGITWSRGWPAIPVVHDEASLVLAGDTFAHGRLTNPTPPFPEHFATFHVLVEPSYASKYPPAQALLLALGQVLTGAPIVGVWISAGILCAALTWMLLAWFPRRWAVWGSLLVTLMLAGGAGSDTYWMSSFWGGTVAASGAALVYGGLGRIMQRPSPLSAVLFALGLGMLALSRPFEGFLVAIPALVAATYWVLRDVRTTLTGRLRRVVTPCALVMVAVGTFSLAHNWRVTGHAVRLPYMEYEAQYGGVPLFLFSARPARAIDYPNNEMRRFYNRQNEVWQERTQSVRSLMRTELGRATEIRRFLVPGLTLILVAAAATSRMRRTLILPLAATALVLTGALTVTWFFPHYIAPVIAPWTIILTAGAERLSTLEPPPGRTGALIAWLIFGMSALSVPAAWFRLREERPSRRASWYMQRDSLERSLKATGRKHLVLVSYGPKHITHDEWVHNDASLNAAAVLWARSLAPEKDARLIDHFRDRVAWRLQVDSGDVPFRIRAIANRSPADLAKQ